MLRLNGYTKVTAEISLRTLNKMPMKSHVTVVLQANMREKGIKEKRIARSRCIIA